MTEAFKSISRFAMRLTVLFTILLTDDKSSLAQQESRWQMDEDGGIIWHIDKRVPHEDHLEMSGEHLSVIVDYGVNAENAFMLSRTIIWPMLRKHPNKTRDHLKRTFNWDPLTYIYVNGAKLTGEKVKTISLNGLFVCNSVFANNISCKRTFFPSVDKPVYLEAYELTNHSNQSVFIEIPAYESTFTTDPEVGIEGKYIFSEKLKGPGSKHLQPGETIHFTASFQAARTNDNPLTFDTENERLRRMQLVKQWHNQLQLETPNEVLNRTFAFAKVRASESIYRTKGGLMHGPGGGEYYAAVWANDQAEYIAPFFPFLGYASGNEASLNAYRHFARFMNSDFDPLPSSITSQGDTFWRGVGDRGDAAMVAYGATRFALALGNKTKAEELWPLIEWCLEYCRRKLNEDGVVASDTDELENRFPSGKANLSTSALYYDALISAGFLAKALSKSASQIKAYHNQAGKLRKAIEGYFGAKVEGYDTYRYYEDNDVLRAWICLPLTVDIFDRKKGTIEALFSPRLWTADGLATEAGKETFWDRSTLYALRGVFAAGEKEKALKYLTYYSNRRLLGEHVPYAVEAYPEGNQRHLSAESGLYCRIYTEGLLGIRPTGLRSFTISPYLPTTWNKMALRKIHAFENLFDIELKREKNQIRVSIVKNGVQTFSKLITEGKPLNINL
ncbi:hypothetical protein ACFOET_08895 [Parapedobacter deserti]|uniref:Six-hairpin glycosidase-like protein n=1 Tax=Parapedobacter deserti TaxID=1912957 RepID=A0ABV7JQY5_9SPHI